MTEEAIKKERIAKRIARAGLCSRRDAERWIADGRVKVNGTLLDSPAFTVSDTDHIVVDGNALPKKERSRLWRYHKPAGLVTSHRDEKGRDTVFDKMPEDMPRVISVGRLDLNSEGLLLLTNDGELARKLELPSTGWKRKYRVRIHGHPRKSDLEKLARGMTVDGIRYDAIDASLDSTKGANSWMTISLREGKNREIRKVMEFLGYTVLRLIRTSYGPLQLGELEDGAVEEVKSKILRDQMGIAKHEEDPDSDEQKSGSRKTLPSRKPSHQGKNPPSGPSGKQPRNRKSDKQQKSSSASFKGKRR
ncbi:MAG: rRNA pseudouridine synthase [Sneathiella sp.]|nr:rRNA pseudouridine synthase [Sneathiella sp.]